MLKNERFLYIMDAITSRGVVTVREIMDACGVSDMTARRDLAELEQEGRLTRVHGGAQGLDFSLPQELSHTEKIAHEEAEKVAIARAALAHIHEQDCVFLGPGTTTEELARQLRGMDVTVVTTSHPVFMALRGDATAKVYLVGGEYRAKTESFVGEITNEQVRAFTFGGTFIGCNGIVGDAIMSSSPAEGVIQKTAIDHAQHRYVLADHTKFGRRALYTYCHLQDFDACITDAGIDPAQAESAGEHTTLEVVEAG